MKKLIYALICILLITSGAAAVDPNPVQPDQLPNQGIVTITTDHSSGIGFNVDEYGVVMTSFSVVKDAKKIKVTFGNGDAYTVEKIYNLDREKDICLFAIPGYDLPKLPLGNSNLVKNGDKATIPAGPGGKENQSVSGTVTATKTLAGLSLFQTTLPVTPVTAGGPLCNERGEVIGILTAAWPDQGSQGAGLAIPINYARGLLQTNKGLNLDVLFDKDASQSPGATVVSPLDNLKKLIPAGTILIDTRTDEILPNLDTSLRQLLVKNKIGVTISGSLQEEYVGFMTPKIEPAAPGNAVTRQRFMTQCAQEIGGYLLSVKINYSSQDYTVFIEYQLIDPANSTTICANSLKDHYGWWSWRRDSETAMVDNSLKKMVKDMGKQLKKKKSNLIHK